MSKRFMSETGRAGLVVCLLLLTAAHAMVVASPASGASSLSPHVERSSASATCAACHSVHSARSSKLLPVDASADSTTVLCLSCHDERAEDVLNVAAGDGDSPAFKLGHTLDASTTDAAKVRGCGTCHDAHRSSSVARMLPARQINGQAVSSSGPGLCMSCHDANDAWYGPDYPSTAEPTRDAAGFPVEGTWPGPDTYLSEANAHRLIPESTQTVGASEPIQRQQGDCLYCHSAHRGANVYDSLVTTYTVPAESTLASDQAEGAYAALCFTCHGGDAPSGLTTAPTNIQQFVTSDGSAGHRITTPGGTLPVGSPLPCFECHNPHGSKRGNASMISDERGTLMSTGDAADVRAFCLTCHTTSDVAAGWDSVASAYAIVEPDDSVVGLARDGGLLRLPENGAHTESDSESCYDCHGSSYAAGGRNVHNPAGGAELSANASMLPSELPTASVDTSLTPADESDETSQSVDATTTVLGSIVPTSPISPAESVPVTEAAGAALTVGARGRRTARRRRRPQSDY